MGMLLIPIGPLIFSFAINYHQGILKFDHFLETSQWIVGDGGTLPYSMNPSLIGQTLPGPTWIQFLVQIQDMDLNDHLAKKSTKISKHASSNSKNTVACSAMTSPPNLDFDLQ